MTGLIMCRALFKNVRRVHIIHAGEDNVFLKGLSGALEKVANPEFSCEYRRFYREEDDRGKIIVDDVNQFVGKCGDKRNKCMIIINESLSLTTPQADNIKNVILEDYTKEDGKLTNFVLLVLKENNHFSDSKFLSNKVTYDEDLEKVANVAVNIWFNTESADAKKINKLAVAAGIVAVGAGAGVAAVAIVPVALGFGGSIAAGSVAASMMSASAIANGGGVAAGSLVAILQSAGATGLTAGAAAAGAGAGGTVTAAVTAGVAKFTNWFK